MRNVLIISNNAISKTESNGRIYSYLVAKYLPSHISNFYVRGNPDIDGVKYISISPKNALFSKLSFGIKKVKLIENSKSFSPNRGSKKSKKVFYHLLRNFSFSKNHSILKLLSNFIIKNNIDTIFLWGSNIPFLYNYAYYFAKKLNIEIVTYTGEDYPLKKYNYISFKHSLLFPIFQKKLFKSASKVYSLSSKNFFTNDDVTDLYKNAFNLKHAKTEYLKSPITKIETKENNDKFYIFYGGNLYIDRVKSIIEIADKVSVFKNVNILIYGGGDDECIRMLGSRPNIVYKGIVPYCELIDSMKNANLLLHVEGFSPFYLKDCKYAFSTKISDYFLSNIPFFVYGSQEISGVKYCLKLIPEFVATSSDELNKLELIVSGKNKFYIDYNVVVHDFGIDKNFDIFE